MTKFPPGGGTDQCRRKGDAEQGDVPLARCTSPVFACGESTPFKGGVYSLLEEGQISVAEKATLIREMSSPPQA